MRVTANRGANAVPPDSRQKRVIIIGAGMSGMLMAIRLQSIGVTNIVILEKGLDVGGTWRDNTYPGLACDVPGYLYTYSFEPNTECSRRYASGQEIQDYFLRVYDKYGVARYVRFGQEVESARFENNVWTVQTVSGTKWQADILISAVGVLHQPNYPDIPGLQNFKGKVFHSARWDHSVDIAGKRVGVVGTGSTAVQIVCGVVDHAESLALFQRTPQWVLPAFDKEYSDKSRHVIRRFPSLARWLHKGYSVYYNSVLGSGFGRERKLFLHAFRRLAEQHLATVSDPELRSKLTPDYPFGCKRFILSDEFYNAMQKPQTRLVTDGIAQVEAAGIRTRNGNLHPLDVLVLATGFKAQNYVRPIRLTGVDGVTLEQAWENGIKAYRSVAIPEFPNFFMLQGPHSPIGNFSLIKIAELQCNYLLQLIAPLCEGKINTIAPRSDATEKFNAGLHEASKNTVWLNAGCQSWYIDPQGRLTIWPWSIRRFEQSMRKPVLEEFEVA